MGESGTRLTRRHFAARGLLGAAALVLAGCAGRGGEPRGTEPRATATTGSAGASPVASPAVTPTRTQTAPTPAASPTAPGTPTPSPAAVDFRVETVVGGLEAPWEVAFAPDGRLFLTERPGRVRVVEDGRLRPEPAATLPQVAATGEGGLLGLALAPDFVQSRALYLYHTYQGAGAALRNRVLRYREEGGRLTEERVILDDIPGARIHDGGRLAFGPDGKLYVTAGDAATPDLAQDPGSPGGKILRLEPDGAIPADNPFPGSPVYSYGHRNPQGLAWQEGTGQLYATEHGASAHDEVNRIAAGANYGWPAARGNDGHREGFVPPVVESGAGATWAPSGATFVRAGTFPQWRGSLLFAALRGQALWRLALDSAGAPRVEAIIRNEYGRLRTVVEGPDGLLYLLTNNRDGRGVPASGDDRLLRLAPA